MRFASLSLYTPQRFARDHGMLFIETSAKLGNNVTEAFVGLAEKVKLQQTPCSALWLRCVSLRHQQ
jgi:hypothetical protein